MNKQHPETRDGLPFEPKGHGFTGSVNPGFAVARPQLTRRTIEATRKHHADSWFEAHAALPPMQRDKRTARLTGMTDDERDRLATLSVLIEQGMYSEDRLHVINDRLKEANDADRAS